MSSTTFSGPVTSTNGFVGDVTGAVTGAVTLPVGLTAGLPAASASNLGQMQIITDNGVGNDEFAVVVSNGTAWVAIATAALS